MKNSNKDNPILIGRLKSFDNEVYSLMGHMGDIQCITKKSYEVLKSMDGFHTVDDLAKKHHINKNEIYSIFNKYYGDKKLLKLNEWNQVGWCENCGVYVAGGKCSICGKQTEKIIFSPPCDPYICFEQDRDFICDCLNEHFSVKMPSNAIFLVNTGVENNTFFWEVAYMGQIVLKIIFASASQESWKYELLSIPALHKKSDSNYSDALSKMLEANKARLEKLFFQSAAFIYESTQLFKTLPLIYFSGGKESLVMLSIFEKLQIEANVLTVLTGVEFPDDKEFVYQYKKRLVNSQLFHYYFFEENGKSIIERLNSGGTLSAKDPWCRVDFKKELKSKGTKIIYKGQDFVAFEGSRWYENDFRRRHPKINFINDYEHQIWAHPIAEWTSFDVWIYLYSNGIPVNPIYKKGFQRTTCWLCPIVSPYHLLNSRKHYPELWSQIKGCKLEAFGDDETKNLPY